MRRILKQEIPGEIKRLQTKISSWEDFRKNHEEEYFLLRKRLLEEQFYLCAYCELILSADNLPENQNRTQVEHFIDREFRPGLILDWPNLLAVCSGGVRSFYSNKNDWLSCDSAKNDKKLSEKRKEPFDIYSPVELPKAAVFRYKVDSGKKQVAVQVNGTVVKEQGLDFDKLKRTIEILNLNCRRLQESRWEVWNVTQKVIIERKKAGSKIPADILPVSGKLPLFVSMREQLLRHSFS